jgi:tetratricopeptide (TPR) repeat protein
MRRFRTIIIIDPMRIAILLTAAFALSPALCLSADGDLVSALLAARNADERAALLRGHDRQSLAAALEGIEKSAGASFDAKEYAAALDSFQAALAVGRELAAAAKLPFYFRRIGMCLALLGHNEDAVAAYREGIAAAEKTDDSAMLGENLHGAALNLQRLGRYREALPLCQGSMLWRRNRASPSL